MSDFDIVFSESPNFNLTPSPSEGTTPSVSYIDFAATPLKRFAGCYALIIDNLFSPEECKEIIALAESTESADGVGWQPAMISTGPRIGDQVLDTEYRSTDRILRFDRDASRKIFERVRPFVEEDIGTIEQGSKWAGIVSRGTASFRGTWNLVGLNERLSFLRYGPGQFFKEHYDGQLELPDGRKSRVTIQIYLNGSSDSDIIEGGSTRFYGSLNKAGQYLDVEPKTGRVLIFQQHGLVHSGEPVLKGPKYAMRTDFMFKRIL